MRISWSNLARVETDDELVVSLATMKRHLNIIHADDDALIRDLILAATGFIEGVDGIGFIFTRSVFEAEFKSLPRTATIPLAPILSVEAVVGGESVQPTWLNRSTGEVEFPASSGPATIRITAGHDDLSTVPAALSQAIRMIVASWYRTRENDLEKGLAEVPLSATRVIEGYRRF